MKNSIVLQILHDVYQALHTANANVDKFRLHTVEFRETLKNTLGILEKVNLLKVIFFL